MGRLAKIRLVGTLAATLPSMLFCGVASSQSYDASVTGVASDSVQNTQQQTGDVFAGQTLNVVDAPGGVNTVTAAVGNSVSAIGLQAPLDFQSSQTVSAQVAALSNVAVAGYGGNVVSSTSATGNTGTAGTCCGALTGNVNQYVGPDYYVQADSYGQVATADSAGFDTSAIGNTQGWNSVNGSVQASTTQLHNGSTHAYTEISADTVYGAAAYTANAVSNNVSVDAANAPVDLTVNQRMDGYTTEAGVKVDQQYAGDLLASATATANNVNISSYGYAAQLDNTQVNYNGVNAESDVTLQNWDRSATSLAYGIGNSAIVSNSGSYTGITNNQQNLANINASSTFVGGAGGDAFSSATAIGNAVSGYACAECQGTLYGNNNQLNTGAAHAQSTLNTNGPVNSATGVSTAVGNTATFQVRRNGG